MARIKKSAPLVAATIYFAIAFTAPHGFPQAQIAKQTWDPNELGFDLTLAALKDPALSTGGIAVSPAAAREAVWAAMCITPAQTSEALGRITSPSLDAEVRSQLRWWSDPARVRPQHTLGAMVVGNQGYGVKVVGITPGSPADTQLRLSPGDLIFALDGFPAIYPEGLERLLERPVRSVEIQWYDSIEFKVRSLRTQLTLSRNEPVLQLAKERSVNHCDLWVEEGLLLKPESSARFMEVFNSPPRLVKAQANGQFLTGTELPTTASLGDFDLGLAMLRGDAALPGKFVAITSSSYPRCSWARPFVKQATRLKKFHPAGEGAAMDVPMMYRVEQLAYGETATCQCVELPLKDSVLSAIIIVPKEGKNLADILLELKTLLRADGLGLRCARVMLEIPKWTFACSINVLGAIRTLAKADGVGSNASLATDIKGAAFTRMQLAAAFRMDESGINSDQETLEGSAAPTDALVEAHVLANRPFIVVLMDRDLDIVQLITVIN